MDLAYQVKQLDLELTNDSRRLAEKKATRDKLWSALSPQERALFRAPAAEKIEPAPPAEPAAS